MSTVASSQQLKYISRKLPPQKTYPKPPSPVFPSTLCADIPPVVPRWSSNCAVADLVAPGRSYHDSVGKSTGFDSRCNGKRFHSSTPKRKTAKRVSHFEPTNFWQKYIQTQQQAMLFRPFKKVGTGSCAFFESWKHSPLWTSPYHWWQSHVWKSPLVAGAFFE